MVSTYQSEENKKYIDEKAARKKRVKLYQVQKAKSMKSLSDSSRENEHGDGKPCIILVHEIITARNVSLKNSNHI